MAGPYCSVLDAGPYSSVEMKGVTDVAKLRKGGARWDSEKVKEWWSRVEARSSLVQFCFDWEDWRLLMEILTRFDVSRIENLFLVLPSRPEPETIPQEYLFGDVVLAAGSGFSALKKVKLAYDDDKQAVRCLGSDSLAKALRSGVLRNLYSLLVNGSCSPEILEALLEGDLPHLTAIRISTEDLPLDVAFQSPRFSKLRGLALIDVDSVAWQSFTHAVQSGNLSNITDFEIGNAKLGNLDDIAKWFSSLKYFGSLNSSEMDFRLLLSALRKAPVTELAWKRLRFLEGNDFLDSDFEELVGLADSGQLPHLDTLDLSFNEFPSKRLSTLIQSIGRGSLPSLQRLDWTANKVDDETVEAIVEAYYANTSLTAHIQIDWERLNDPSLRTKLETYRDRNEKLVELVVEKKRSEQRIGEEEIGGEKQVQDLQDLVPLTSARVFICGYAEVGKTTLRKTLLRHFEKCPEVETGAEARTNPEGESGPEVGRTPAVERGFEIRPNLDVERSSEVVRTAAKKPSKYRFGMWGCCLNSTLSKRGRASLTEKRSLPNEQCATPNEERLHPKEETKLPNQEPRTRGIEVSRIEDSSNGGSTTLVLWDLAGQQEYHILHSAFLADRGPISGKSTTFILVFRAAYKQSVQGELLYWLRMLASSSPPGVKRPVMIVLNRFEGERSEEEIDGKLWMGDIKKLSILFAELDVCLKPFYIDVREAADVQQLRNHLFDTAQNLLKECRVPRVFLNLQMKLKGWSEKEECLPIYTWEAFKNTWDLEPAETVKDLERCASILHEIGEVIYLNKSIVVPDPEWFCKRIVGELLLPEAIYKRQSPFTSDGKISITSFQSFFEDSLVKSTKTDDIISMLQYIGLCYKSGEEHLIVPALIRDDDYSTIGWSGPGDEVMGRSFTTEDQVHSNADQEKKKHEGQESKCAEGRKYIIPAALFRHLQVKLADHEDFGLRGDGNYTVGKSFLSCTVGRLFVLVQFDVNLSDPTDDRIDILVQIRQDSSNMKENPVECICQIMEIVERLCIAVCPGLKYQIKCIEPSSASKNIQDMSGRKLMSLNEIKERVVKGEECLSWRTVGGDFVKPETCLSKSELNAVVDTVKGRYVACQNDQKAMRIFATKAAGDEASRSNESARDKILAPGSNDLEQLLRNQTDEFKVVVRKEGDRIVRHIDEKMEELKSVLLDFRQKHDRLVMEIQAQRALFIADKVSGVPRYIFLSKRETGPWMSITEAFRKTYHLHFLCEARFEKNGDHRLMHEVEKQEGIKLKNPQEWLVKAKPWLRWSLQVAVIVGKTVGNVYLPGIFSLIPDIDFLDSNKLAKAVDTAAAQLLGEGINFLETDKLAKAVDTAAAQILEEGRDANQVQDHDKGYGNASQPVNLEENVIAESVVADLKHELRGTDFAKKTKLSRMMFREAVGSTSDQSQSPVVWICEDCIKKYGSKVVPFC